MAKRSRRERRQEPGKLNRPLTDSASAASNTTPPAAPVRRAQLEPEAPQVEVTSSRKAAVNFGQEYYYVYQELKTITIVAIAMFIVLFALSFVI
ncbi:MAG: hypothetical protein KDF65_06865 [Anaerolineae bacterium]|nr:hypothetical protein [Anaerolineae bacterium]